MKKILLKIFLLFCSVALLYFLIDNCIMFCNKHKSVKLALSLHGLSISDISFDTYADGTDFWHFLFLTIIYLIQLIINVILFVLFCKKDITFLTKSIIAELKEKFHNNSIKRKAKKQEKLQAEIDEKQAKLDEMKKDGE